MTDTKQRFEFAGLAPGLYEIELVTYSGRSANPKLKVDVREGSVLELVLTDP